MVSDQEFQETLDALKAATEALERWADQHDQYVAEYPDLTDRSPGRVATS